MTGADSYYFDVNWEVCARSGEKFFFFKDRLRSAVRIINNHYYLAGPDLKSRPEFSEPDEGWRGLIHGGASPGNMAQEQIWRLPGEPLAVFVNFGKKMSSKFHLYELWEDSGLEITQSAWTCLEPVMYNHACRTILELITGSEERSDLFFGTGRLCVKRKTPEPETVFNSVAAFQGRLNYSGHANIYFESSRPDEKSAIIGGGMQARNVSLLADASGVAPLSLEPLFAPEGKPGAFFPGFERDGAARSSDEPAGKKFFARVRQDDRNSLSGLLWIMEG
jgi:hypothetical protein